MWIYEEKNYIGVHLVEKYTLILDAFKLDPLFLNTFTKYNKR